MSKFTTLRHGRRRDRAPRSVRSASINSAELHTHPNCIPSRFSAASCASCPNRSAVQSDRVTQLYSRQVASYGRFHADGSSFAGEDEAVDIELTQDRVQVRAPAAAAARLTHHEIV